MDERLTSETLDNLVTQFSSVWDFLRELVQNSIDSLEDPRVSTLMFSDSAGDSTLSRGFAVLLLSVYGHMNLESDDIDLDHELEFQRRVLRALSGGRLHTLRLPKS